MKFSLLERFSPINTTDIEDQKVFAWIGDALSVIKRLEEDFSSYALDQGHSWDGKGYYGKLYQDIQDLKKRATG